MGSTVPEEQRDQVHVILVFLASEGVREASRALKAMELTVRRRFPGRRLSALRDTRSGQVSLGGQGRKPHRARYQPSSGADAADHHDHFPAWRPLGPIVFSRGVCAVLAARRRPGDLAADGGEGGSEVGVGAAQPAALAATQAADGDQPPQGVQPVLAGGPEEHGGLGGGPDHARGRARSGDPDVEGADPPTGRAGGGEPGVEFLLPGADPFPVQTRAWAGCRAAVRCGRRRWRAGFRVLFRLILGERHLGKVLAEYARHYNRHRPHQGLQQQCPQRQPSRAADITARIEHRQVPDGLITEYHRAA